MKTNNILGNLLYFSITSIFLFFYFWNFSEDKYDEVLAYNTTESHEIADELFKTLGIK